MPQNTLVLGAVAYLPKVVTIWEGMREYFLEAGLPFDFVLFSNYEQQVQFLLENKIDIAWNTPLAHIRVKHQTKGQSISLGMRDSDREFHCRVVALRKSNIQSMKDLEGKRLGVGSRDSTQARILPLHFLQKEGINLKKIEIVPFDTDVGKHGDTGTSELEALKALKEEKIDAVALGDLIWLTEQSSGRIDPTKIHSLWTSPGFDHCMFDARPGLSSAFISQFTEKLMAMSWENPKHRNLLELEGLRKWLPPREEGYASLIEACKEQGVPI